MHNNILLSTKNLDKSFTTSKETTINVLKSINLDIEQNKIIGLMGPSGAGKSTLLHIIGTLDVPTKGEVIYYIDQKEINVNSLSDTERAKFRNKHIGFVFQFHHLLPEFNALENVMIPALISGRNLFEAKKEALELIETVGVLHRIKNYPSELSGGEQQRIAIARAIINKPTLILADEPTGNLDAKNANAVLELLLNLKKEYNITIIIATHSNEVAQICDKIIRLKDGILQNV